MQKKLLTVAGAVVLTIAMATTAFASNWVGSVEGSKPTSNDVTITDAPQEVVDEITNAKDIASIVSGSTLEFQAAVYAANKDINPNTLKPLTVFEADGAIGTPVSFTIGENYNGKAYVVFHKTASGAWEIVGAGFVEGGAVSATFTSYSPVMIMIGEKRTSTPVTGGETTNTTTGSTTVSSPNTGVNGVEFALVFSIAAAAAVAVFAAKKIKE